MHSPPVLITGGVRENELLPHRGFCYHETVLNHISSCIIGPLVTLGARGMDDTAAYEGQVVQPAPPDWQGNEKNRTIQLIFLPFPRETPGKRLSVYLKALT